MGTAMGSELWRMRRAGFVSHVGEVCPSEFPQISAGNMRERTLVGIYLQSPLFRKLRDPRQLRGTCGAREFTAVGTAAAPALTL